MQEMTLPEIAIPYITLPPTADELPSDDGIPMETGQHRIQMNLLIETLEQHWADRDDFFAGGNMFIYFSPQQVRDYDYRGPDVFVALDVPRHPVRKSWVVWQEGKGPDVIIELISESTAAFDKREKKRIYQNRLRVPEYFWYDPLNGDWAGFALREGRYIPIEPDAHGRLLSQQLQLTLVRWQGVHNFIEATWLRWATLDGTLLPTSLERAEQERIRAEQERVRADAVTQHAATLEAALARYREQFGELPGLDA